MLTNQDKQKLQAAGFSAQEIQDYEQSRGGSQGQASGNLGSWFTGGRAIGQGALINAGMQALNIPSYAIGGILNQAQQGSLNPFTGVAQGISQKQSVMEELPKTFGVDPNSAGGMALGFAGELLTPGLPVGKLAGLANKGLKATDRLADAQKMLGRGAESFGENYLTAGLGSPKTLGDAVKLAPQGVADLFDKYKIYSRDPEDIRRAMSQAGKAYESAIDGAKNPVDAQRLFLEATEKIKQLKLQAKLGSKTAGATARDMNSRLNKLRKATRKEGGLSATMLREYRKALDLDIPRTGFSTTPQAIQSGAKELRNLYKQSLNRAVPQARTLGREYAALKKLEPVTTSAANRANAKILAGLPRIGSAGVGAMLGGVPGALVGVGAEALVSSSKGVELISKGARRAGKAIQRAKLPKITFGPKARAVKKLFTTGIRVSGQPRGE